MNRIIDIRRFIVGEGPDRPAWLAFDKQVLCFDAYFQESITERPDEQYRIRKCRVYFYPEDDTVQGMTNIHGDLDRIEC
jgi:hypothetical protein